MFCQVLCIANLYELKSRCAICWPFMDHSNNIMLCSLARHACLASSWSAGVINAEGAIKHSGYAHCQVTTHNCQAGNNANPFHKQGKFCALPYLSKRQHHMAAGCEKVQGGFQVARGCTVWLFNVVTKGKGMLLPTLCHTMIDTSC